MTKPRSDSRSVSSVATVPCGPALQWGHPLESGQSLSPDPQALLRSRGLWALYPLAPGLQVSLEPPDPLSWAQCLLQACCFQRSSVPFLWSELLHGLRCAGLRGHRQGASPAELRDEDSESGTRVGWQPVWMARLVCVDLSESPGPDSGRAGKA